MPWLVCKALNESFFGYMQGIYLRPMLTAIPALLLARVIKEAGVAGNSWPQLIGMGAFCAAAVFLPALFTCLTSDHRRMMLHAVTERVLGRRA